MSHVVIEENVKIVCFVDAESETNCCDGCIRQSECSPYKTNGGSIVFGVRCSGGEQ